jgi:methionyl-tRNA formyltransferase
MNNKDGLRVVLITQGISRLVKPLMESRHNLVGIIEAAPRKQNIDNQSVLVKKLKKIYAFIKQIQNLNTYCIKNHLPYFYLDKTTDDKAIEWLENIKPDIIVVFSMSHLLKEKIYSWPKYKTINLHPAYLPEFRGPKPDVWYYYYQITNPGVTVHYVDKGEDTGDIIYQERVKVELGIKSPQRLDKLIGEVGVKLVLKALDSIQKDDAPRIKQPVVSPTPRARNIKPEEHSTIINWKEWKIDRIWNFLRGTELWLNALPLPKKLYKGQRWIIEEMIPLNNVEESLWGHIKKENNQYYVYCNGGKIHLTIKLNIKVLIKNLIHLS